MALRFEDMLERLGSQGRAALLDTYRLFTQGLIDQQTFIDVASQLLEHIANVGANYGRLSYIELMTFMVEEYPGASSQLGAASAVDQGKVAQSLQTILEGDPEQIISRLERLGYVLPMEETQRGYGDELRADPLVEGWQRGLNDDACQLCQWWSWEGRIWPKVQPFQSHKGCKCQQIPKLARESGVPSTVRQRALERREQAIANRDRRSNFVREAEQRVREELKNIV